MQSTENLFANSEIMFDEEFDICLKELKLDQGKVTGTYEIDISDDAMSAHLITIPSSQGEFQIDKEYLYKKIGEKGITFGLIENIHETIPKFRKAKTLIAKGKLPVSGIDAKTVMKNQEIIENEKEDLLNSVNNIDHHEVHTFSCVNNGEIIVEIVPSIEGEDGFKVTGEKIPHRKGKDLVLIQGENTRLSDDKRYLIATAPGIVERNGDIFSVSSLLTIDSDVDYSVGNIDFQGIVKINGNVLPGFKIKAKKLIEIEGNVDKAIIESGGDVIIKKGYYGDNNSYLNCAKDLKVRSLENAIVNCQGNVYAEQYIINSKIHSKNNVQVIHKTKGRIIGGRIIAGGTISVNNLGSPSIVKTIIEMGSPNFRGKDQNLIFNMTNYYTNSLRRLNSQIQWLKNIQLKKELPPMMEEKLNLLKEKSVRIRNKLNDLINSNTNTTDMEIKVQYSDEAMLHVFNVAYAGVQILSPGSFIKLERDYFNVKIREKEDKIEIMQL